MKGYEWLVRHNLPVVVGDPINEMEIIDRTTTVPTVNLNGTSGQDLLEQYIDSTNALRHAIDVIRKNPPNARDYPLHPPNSFDGAMKEHQFRIKMLEIVLADLQKIGEHVAGMT